MTTDAHRSARRPYAGASHRRRRLGHGLRVGFAAAFALAVWLLWTEPWGLGVLQLLVFMAPGGLLGLGTAWMANATKPHAFSWRTGRTAAIRGALILPPILGFIVGLDGNDRLPHLLAGFVRTAWLAFIVGGAVAVSRLIRLQSIRARRRHARRGLQHA